MTTAMQALGGSLGTEEQRGRHIYFTGTSPSGSALGGSFGEASIELSGKAVACAGCHGYDGKGRPESGLFPANITWRYLTKSYGHIHQGGSGHEPFDASSLKHFLRTGMLPGGGKADPGMPVLTISDRDLDDLVAFLRRVGDVPEPGVSETSIKIGCLVPRHGRSAKAGAALVAALQTYFDGLNRGGGIFGRNVALVKHEVSIDIDQAKPALQQWLSQEKPFALVSILTPALGDELESILAAETVPVISPVAPLAHGSSPLGVGFYYLSAGIVDEVVALSRFAVAQKTTSGLPVGLVYPRGSASSAVVDSVEHALTRVEGLTVSKHLLEDADKAEVVASTFFEPAARNVIFLGSGDQLSSFLRGSHSEESSLTVLVPGSLAGRAAHDLPQHLMRQVYLAYPTIPSDRKRWAITELEELMGADREGRTGVDHVIISAVSAAKVLEEGLRRAGRDLTRRGLTAELNKFYMFDTGLMPPVTFTQNRNVGAKGAYVVKLADTNGFPRSMGWVATD